MTTGFIMFFVTVSLLLLCLALSLFAERRPKILKTGLAVERYQKCGGDGMMPILKCIHPLIPASIGLFLFLLLLFGEDIKLGDLFPVGQTAGPCSGLPVFLFFLPSYFLFLLGAGFSGIRGFELRCKRRRSREEAE